MPQKQSFQALIVAIYACIYLFVCFLVYFFYMFIQVLVRLLLGLMLNSVKAYILQHSTCFTPMHRAASSASIASYFASLLSPGGGGFLH